MRTQTAQFYAYLDPEYLEIKSMKTGYSYKIFSQKFEQIPAYLMGEIKRAIEKNKKEKVKKTIWDTYNHRNQYRQIFLDLERGEAHLLHDLSRS